jgi:hypothetical protein
MSRFDYTRFDTVRFDAADDNGVYIYRKLDVLAGDKLLVPGCEPTSTISSKMLAAQLRERNCGTALVDLADALEAIPGSTIEYGIHWTMGYRKKWLVLPPVKQGCPCTPVEDYYAILRELANQEEPVTEKYDYCAMDNMGFCPSPGFEFADPPPPSPYIEPGTPYEGAGVLPPMQPWITSED